MSNCIQVGTKYCPFLWEGETLKAYVSAMWVAVAPTGKKNKYGERIFQEVGDKAALRVRKAAQAFLRGISR